MLCAEKRNCLPRHPRSAGTVPPPAAAAAAAKPPRRILSVPNFARLLSRKSSLDGGSSGGNSGGLSVGRSATEPTGGAGNGFTGSGSGPSLLDPSPSLLGPRASYSSGALAGAMEPLSMSAVVYGAEAVRRGIDTLGVPPAGPSWWLTGADPLAAMIDEQQRLHAQIARCADSV